MRGWNNQMYNYSILSLQERYKFLPIGICIHGFHQNPITSSPDQARWLGFIKPIKTIDRGLIFTCGDKICSLLDIIKLELNVWSQSTWNKIWQSCLCPNSITLSVYHTLVEMPDSHHRVSNILMYFQKVFYENILSSIFWFA